MGEQGKQLLKQHIKHKRASEGVTEIPDDLFAKRPRYEMTSEELVKRNQKRQKNKEAAEKSRRKKKEEFLNLQTENDQLQHDKCQLVSMIEQLKSTLNNLSKENTTLRRNIDLLKRWIGKHAADLGLGKHVQKKQDGEKLCLARTTESGCRKGVLRGNPSLHSAGAEAKEDEDQLPSSASSLLSSSTARFSASLPLAASPSAFPLSKTPTRVVSPASPWAVSECSSPQRPTQQFFQSVGIRTVVTLPQPPALHVAEKPPENLHDREPRQQQGVVYDGGQQVVYLSKDSVFIVPGEDGRQFMMVKPGVQRQTQQDVPEGLQIITATQYAPQIGFEASEVQKTSMETSEAQDASVETLQARVKTPEAQEASVEVPESNAKTPDTQEATVEAMEASVEATHATTKAPEMEASGDIGNTQEAPRGDLIEKGAAANETTTSIGETESLVSSGGAMLHPDLATSIDVLLKLGCTIQLPEGYQLVKTAEARPLGENHDHPELSQSHRPS